MYNDPGSHVHVNCLYIRCSCITHVVKYYAETSVRFIGIWADDTLSFSIHISKLKSKLVSDIYALRTSSKLVSLKVRNLIYRSLVESHICLASIMYGASNSKLLGEIRVLQKKKKSIIILARAKYNALMNYAKLIVSSNLMTLFN